MSFSAGKLRHRVRIDKPVQTRNAAGAASIGWEEVATVWAAIEPLSAKEFIQSGAEQSKVVARIVMRRRELPINYRLVHGANIYNLTGVLPDRDSGQEYMTVPVSTGVNDGR